MTMKLLLAIKQSIGKLIVIGDVDSCIEKSNFQQLPISSEHAWVTRQLPMIHKDPFDRMLVAQAMVEKATIVTSRNQTNVKTSAWTDRCFSNCIGYWAHFSCIVAPRSAVSLPCFPRPSLSVWACHPCFAFACEVLSETAS